MTRSRSVRAGRVLMMVVLAAAGVAACTPSGPVQTAIESLTPADLAEGQRLQVAATTSIVADILRQVGGDAVALTTVMAPGLDPHDYEPTAREIQDLVGVDAVFLSGLGLEAGLEQAIVDSGVDAPRVSLSEGIDGTADPHVWLDPRLVLIWVDNAARALSGLDPAHASDYAARAEAYKGDIKALDRRLRSMVDEIPAEDRKIVSEHDMLGHLAEGYGLRVVGNLIPSTSSVAEPSPRDLAALQSAMKAEDVHVIVVSASSSAHLAQTFAADHNAKLVRIYVESLSEAGGPADTYLNLMEYNLAAIVDALKR